MDDDEETTVRRKNKHHDDSDDEPVKIKEADEGLMKDDNHDLVAGVTSPTTFTKSDKSVTRAYRRRNSASEESEPEKSAQQEEMLRQAAAEVIRDHP